MEKGNFQFTKPATKYVVIFSIGEKVDPERFFLYKFQMITNLCRRPTTKPSCNDRLQYTKHNFYRQVRKKTLSYLMYVLYFYSFFWYNKECVQMCVIALVEFHILGCIYTREKAKTISLPICCIVFNLCVYTTATAAATKIKEKIAFALV